MGKFYGEIPDFLITWISKQEIFWVASAPLAADGHVNVSPKGLAGSFHVVSPHKVWYEDCSGSGIETISHLRENGRITILFSAFEGPPRIARLFGKGTVHEFGTPEYEAFLPIGERKPGSRAAIVINVHLVGTSCGFAVPLYTFERHRTQLISMADTKEAVDIANTSPDTPPAENGMKGYWAGHNTRSIDGLPGLQEAFRSPVKFQNRHTVQRTDVSVGLSARLSKVVGGMNGFLDFRSFISFVTGVLAAALYFRLAGSVY